MVPPVGPAVRCSSTTRRAIDWLLSAAIPPRRNGGSAPTQSYSCSLTPVFCPQQLPIHRKCGAASSTTCCEASQTQAHHFPTPATSLLTTTSNTHSTRPRTGLADPVRTVVEHTRNGNSGNRSRWLSPRCGSIQANRKGGSPIRLPPSEFTSNGHQLDIPTKPMKGLQVISSRCIRHDPDHRRPATAW